MNKTLSSPAEFLNLDLELTSIVDLNPLVAHFGNNVFVLINEENENGYFLCLEPIIEGTLSDNIENCINHFIQLVSELPNELIEIWNSCTLRVFDFGFDGGLEELPLHTTITAESLNKIVHINAEIRITIYPFRENQE